MALGQNHGRGTPAEGGSDCGVVAAPGVGPAEEQVCRRLAEAVPLMLWTATAGGECDFVNARWYEVTGQARGGDPARGWSQVVHPADLPAAKAHWSGCVARGADFSAEFRLRDAQGAYRWHVARAVPLRDESGRVLKWFGACSDVDDRRRAERDREFLSAIVEGSEDAVVGLGLDGAVTFWSEGAHRLFGYSSSEVLGRPVGDLLPPSRRGEAAALIRGGRDGPVGRSASEWVAKGGRLVDVALSASSIRDETGRVVGLALVARDISGRKLDEEAVRRYAGRLESLHAIDQTILSARPLEEVAGSALRHLARFVPVWHAGVVTFRPGDEQALVIASLGSLAESRPVGSLVPTRRLEASPTPAERQVRTRAWLPLSHHGEVFGSLELASDRPDAFTPAHLEMAQEVADLLSIAIEQAMLYEQVRLSKENLASISRRLIRAEEDVRRRISRELHDEIGQALSVLKIQLQNAGLRGEGRSGLVESVRLVERTLGQVRDLSLDLRPSLLDDMGLASALRSLLRRLARAAGFRAEFRPEGDGPGPRYDPELETACYRVAQEALTNAARHAGAGVVSVELVDGEDRLTLVVRDDGSGFDPDEALALARDGASLGLVGMGERVALLGGRFEIVSAPGKGTLVRASFPCPGRRSI